MEEEVSFEVNEDVIIDDNGIFYEGRILEIKGTKYLVHFNGWAKKYDKWVTSDLISKQNEMNRALMKMNNKSNKDKDDKPYYKMSLIRELNALSEIKQKYEFPFILKQRLIEEWYVIESQQRLLPLPRVPNVKQILQTWESECKAESSISHQNSIELIQGLIFYVDNCMDRSIIYRQEMPQFEKVKQLHPSGLIDVFGAEHLLRVVYMLPIMYSSTDISEKESELVHEVVLGLYQFLLRHSNYFCNLEEYTTLDNSLKDLIAAGRTYPKQSPGHTKNCISVSSDGFIALIDKYVWRVLNPFTNSIFSFPGGVGKVDEEEDEANSKKRPKADDQGEHESNTRKELCLVQWSPEGFGFNNSCLLLTIRYDPAIELWCLPSTLGSHYMEKTGDLLSVITSTAAFSKYCQPIRSFSSCFNQESLSLIVSINSVLFFFSFRWIDSELNINLELNIHCQDDISCCTWDKDSLLCGTTSGKVIKVSLPGASKDVPSVSSSFPVSSIDNSFSVDSVLHPVDPQSQSTSRSPSLIPPIHQPTHPTPSNLSLSAGKLFQTRLHSSQTEIEAFESVLLPSILDSPHPLQGSIQSISHTPHKLLIHDGVHLCFREGSNPWMRTTIPDGILCLDPEFHIITKAYQLIDLFSTTQSIPAFLPPVMDFTLIDAVAVDASSFLLLFYFLTAMKTTTVDFRLQNYALYSLTTQRETSWIPGAVLFSQGIQEPLMALWQQRKMNGKQMQMMHGWMCRQIRVQGKLPMPTSEFLELRGMLLRDALGSVSHQDDDDRVVCKCCGERCFRNEGHAEWCCLSSIDLYDPIHGQLLEDAIMTYVCPCCYQQYVDASKCIYCGLKLMASLQGASTIPPINKQYIYQYFGSDVSDVWNQG